MYPKISDFLNDLTGLHLALPLYTYGFFLALAILTATVLTGRELDRLQAKGVLSAPTPSRADRGRKSRRGSFAAAPGKASDVMPTVMMIAFVLGLVGSRAFYILENLRGFFADPWKTMTSGSGLSFYGGFLLAAAAIVGTVRRSGIPIGRFVDAAAPTILLAYGIARIGCQLSGDGDWGIPADMGLKPEWLPTWLWAETYPGNVEGIVIPPPGVYPTPIYETAASFVLSGILFRLRKRPFRAGWLFSLMLVLMGFERFWIEKIRVNPRFELFALHPTQAEVVSVVLLAAGAAGLFACRSRT